MLLAFSEMQGTKLYVDKYRQRRSRSQSGIALPSVILLRIIVSGLAKEAPSNTDMYQLNFPCIGSSSKSTFRPRQNIVDNEQVSAIKLPAARGKRDFKIYDHSMGVE